MIDYVQVAQVAYEANRTMQTQLGEEVDPPFKSATYYQINEVIQRVMNAFAGETPEEYHKAWVARRRDKGWVYGPGFNSITKTHPNMVNYQDLPQDQVAKDSMFETIVNAFKDWNEAHELS